MEKNCIKISSDPYRKHIDYAWLEENNVWSSMANIDDAPLNEERFISESISHNAYDILRVITEKLYNPTVGLEIVFEGTDDDYADFSAIKELYFSEYDIEIRWGGRKMRLAKDVMPQIEASYAKLKEFFTEYPDSNTEAIINKYNETVKPEIAICVMGLYSSGKSAFINSLIGREVLPSESDPATAKIYKIRGADSCSVIFRFQGIEYKIKYSGNEWRFDKNTGSEIIMLISEKISQESTRTEEQNVYWTLYALNEYAKNEGKLRHKELVECADRLLSEMELKTIKSDEEKIEKLLKKRRIKELIHMNEISPNKLDDVIEVYIDFNRSYLPLDKFKFVIYDTPGSNSVMFREHADILKDSLEQQTNGLPIFVTKPDSMDETDNNDIMSIISEMGGALDKSNMMLVVNKSDDLSITALQKKVENKDNLIVTKWRSNRIYFVSSIIGLGGKKNNPEDDEEWINDDYSTTFGDKQDRFENPENKRYMRLFDFNILPRDARERISRRTENLNKDELLLWNSGIPCVEEDIGIFAQKYALYNKCTQAIQYLTEAVKDVQKRVYSAQKEAEILKMKSEVKLEEKKQNLVNELREEGNRKKSKFTTDYSNNEEKVALIDKYLNKNRIKAIIEEAHSSSPGKNDYEKMEPFNKKIEENLKKDILNYSKEASQIVGDYWKKCATELRESLTRIVVGSDALTDEQKEVLKEELLKVSPVSSKHKTLNIKDNDDAILFNKGERFLWIFGRMTTILEEKCRDEYRNALDADITSNNLEATNLNEKWLEQWVGQLITKLESVILSFNPELAELSRELDEINNVLKKKTEEEDVIGFQLNVIQRLMNFEEVK